ncbi:MAG: DUF5615 family PIN-like protein [Planctomycetaceae bacterium]|nr:DUF5615 family PIN-like protein [Planctomycetaceae bacterium]
MSRFLANENLPRDVIVAARSRGYDIEWITEIAPGASDEEVLRLGMSAQRVLVTFDKDFGELAFHHGAKATCGIILLRPRVLKVDELSRFVENVLSQAIQWEGHFSVADVDRIRVTPLPPG